jgi:hypothetical protein
MSGQNEAQESAEYIPFEEFRNGLPHGRFHVIVNPKLAAPFVLHRTYSPQLGIAVIGIGIAAALLGYPWVGGVLVVTGILLPRAVKTKAAGILLILATREAAVYEQATEQGVMEVRRA